MSATWALTGVFAFEELASVVGADVRRERVLPEAHLAELVRRHAVGTQRDDPRLRSPAATRASTMYSSVALLVELKTIFAYLDGLLRAASPVPGKKERGRAGWAY